MSLSIRQALRYPLATPDTQRRFLVLCLLAALPGVGALLMGPFATAVVSVITRERYEVAPLDSNQIISRSLCALLAGFVSSLYLVPVLIGFAVIGFSLFHGGNVTWPAVLLLIYGILVCAALPLATLHAVTTGNIWNALHLPDLVYIGLKGHFVTFFRLFFLSIILVGMKIAAGFLALVGVGIVLAPIKGYVEYVFQYALAYAYVEGIPAAKRGAR